MAAATFEVPSESEVDRLRPGTRVVDDDEFIRSYLPSSYDVDDYYRPSRHLTDRFRIANFENLFCNTEQQPVLYDFNIQELQEKFKHQSGLEELEQKDAISIELLKTVTERLIRLFNEYFMVVQESSQKPGQTLILARDFFDEKLVSDNWGASMLPSVENHRRMRGQFQLSSVVNVAKRTNTLRLWEKPHLSTNLATCRTFVPKHESRGVKRKRASELLDRGPEIFPPPTVEDYDKSICVTVCSKYPEKFFEYWLQHMGHKTIRRVIFNPSIPPGFRPGSKNNTFHEICNTWTGLPYYAPQSFFAGESVERVLPITRENIKAYDEPARCFLEHLLHVICNGDRNAFVYVLGWLTLRRIKPDTSMQTILMLVGKQGCGKSAFQETIVKLLGEELAIYPQRVTDLFTEKFNSSLWASKSLVCADELTVSSTATGSKEANRAAIASVLKTLTTGKTVSKDKKYAEREELENHLGFILSSNDLVEPIPADLAVRRALFLEVSDRHIKDRDYFERYHRLVLDNEETGMCAVDITLHMYASDPRFCENFKIEEIPKTSMQLRMLDATKADYEVWWSHCLATRGIYQLNVIRPQMLRVLQQQQQDGSAPTPKDDWPKMITINELYDSYRRYTTTVLNKQKPSENVIDIKKNKLGEFILTVVFGIGTSNYKRKDLNNAKTIPLLSVEDSQLRYDQFTASAHSSNN